VNLPDTVFLLSGYQLWFTFGMMKKRLCGTPAIWKYKFSVKLWNMFLKPFINHKTVPTPRNKSVWHTGTILKNEK
jgi:hypothetical protein